jgi:hypothetical protein
MPEEKLLVVADMTSDPVELALSRVKGFVSANSGRKVSAGEFWNYLSERDAFYVVDPVKKEAWTGFEAGERGFRFARMVLNEAAGKGLCRKDPDEDLWEAV